MMISTRGGKSVLVSMTGFGQGEVSAKNFRVSVEIRTVNHRFLDFSMKLPRALAAHEREIRDIVKERISRGRVSVTISIDSQHPESSVSFNASMMEWYLGVLRKFVREHELKSDVDINTLALLPDVFTREEAVELTATEWRKVRKALAIALEGCYKMRRTEGKALEKDIHTRMATLKRLSATIEKEAPRVIQSARRAMRERIEGAMGGVDVDNERWMTEAAILADRLDFTEETTRLRSHIEQFADAVSRGGAVSKRLTYLLQEIHREATTIGSKASDSSLVEKVVLLKEEVEKLREQVQNIE